MIQSRFFFMHIPKTAGRYMWSLISENYPRGRAKFWAPEDCNGFLSRRNHLGLDALSGHLPYTTRWLFPDRKNVFTYTILRDPVDRMFSQYMHLTRMRPDLSITLDEFVSSTHADNIQTRMLGSSIQIDRAPNAKRADALEVSIERFLLESRETEDGVALLEAAVRRLDKLDAFGIKEFLGESGRRLVNKTGLSIEVEERHDWHLRYARRLDDSDTDMLKTANALDAELYQEAVKRFENSHC